MKFIRRVALILLLLAIAGGAGAWFFGREDAGLTQASSTLPAIVEDLSCADPGTDIPVVLVHGLRATAGTWGEGGTGASLTRAISSLDGFVVDTFDYGQVSDRWVTDPRIGPSLAGRIRCLSEASRAGGGTGTVILIGHSMGGLAIREALAILGSEAVERVGLAVTIATPHEGSPLATTAYPGSSQPFLGLVSRPLERSVWELLGRRCTDQKAEAAGPGSLCDLLRLGDSEATAAMVPGSVELRALPRFPAGLPVKTIGSDLVVGYTVTVAPLSARVVGVAMGDLVVREESSVRPDLAAYPESGGGVFVKRCGPIPLNVSAFLGAGVTCDHRHVIGDPDVVATVTASLRAWLSRQPGNQTQH